jgi:peroxiredoxin
VPLLLVGAWFLVTGMVRRHVDGQIQRTVGEKLSPFALRDTAGGEWTPERLRGRPALLHFFRSRCEACDREAEAWRAFEESVGESASILHVVTDAVLQFPPEETTATIAGKKFARPVLIADAAFVESFHRATWSNVTPVTYVVDAECRVVKALRGAQALPDLVAALASAR